MSLCLNHPSATRLPHRRHTAAVGLRRSTVDAAPGAQDPPVPDPPRWETDPFQDVPIAVVLVAIAVAVLGPMALAFVLAV